MWRIAYAELQRNLKTADYGTLAGQGGGEISGSRDEVRAQGIGVRELVWMFQMKGTFMKIRLCVALIVRAVGRLLKQRCARICEQSVRERRPTPVAVAAQLLWHGV